MPNILLPTVFVCLPIYFRLLTIVGGYKFPYFMVFNLWFLSVSVSVCVSFSFFFFMSLGAYEARIKGPSVIYPEQRAHVLDGDHLILPF